MAENDISKIVGLIMQNPKLIEDIKGLVESDNKSESPSNSNEDFKAEKELQGEAKKNSDPIPTVSTSINEKAKRAALLSAIKPYVSKERGAAIDSMITISEILDMMKSR